MEEEYDPKENYVYNEQMAIEDDLTILDLKKHKKYPREDIWKEIPGKTPREKIVYTSIKIGLYQNQIASMLGVHYNTVYNIVKKFRRYGLLLKRQ